MCKFCCANFLLRFGNALYKAWLVFQLMCKPMCENYSQIDGLSQEEYLSIPLPAKFSD